MGIAIEAANTHPKTCPRNLSRDTRASAELIIADGLCPAIASLAPGALHEHVELGHTNNPIAAIATELQRRRREGRPVETLHIVAHGVSGAFSLGGKWVSATELNANADELAQWQISRIALWSCQTGKDINFISILERLTGCTAYASPSKIGGNILPHLKRLTNSTGPYNNSNAGRPKLSAFNNTSWINFDSTLAPAVIASFTQIFNASFVNGNTFAPGSVPSNTSIRLYPLDPTSNGYDPSVTFVNNGSTNTVWLSLDGGQQLHSFS